MAISKRLLRDLKKIAGSGNVRAEPEDLLAYSRDGTLAAALPDAIVSPATVAEVAAVVRKAAAAEVPVVPRGAGTGLSGGALAARGGIVLHFSRMNRIVRLDESDLVASVEPGCVNWDLKQAALASGLFYPPDPSSMRVCTLGGNVAENAGGPCGVKYGVTGDYVLGVEAVLASGEVIRTGVATRRNVSGYNLTALMTGSEGTLAVITRITLRLLPLPAASRTVLFAFDDVVTAGEAVVSLGKSGVAPAALEIMDKTSATVAAESHSWLPADREALLLVEVDGEPEGVAAQIARAVSLCRSTGGVMIREAATREEAEPIWEARRAVSPALARRGPNKLGEDVSVPRGRVPEMIRRIDGIARSHELTIAVFGHAGDGNLHPNILMDKRDAAMMRRVSAAAADILQAALDLGGTLSGEHGIGTAKAPFMAAAVSPQTRAAMLSIKRALDPADIMNPGKIFISDQEAPIRTGAE